VEVLERALVERPGRIDVAVEVPLPDDVGRRTLFRLYGSALAVTAAELDAAADACAGVTASFVKECVRRAVLIAAERGAATASGEDLDSALLELLGARDELAGRLLGGDAGARHGHAPADLGGYC
jgi:ATP-dependent 26S proteasome regulatory subunit